MTKAFLIGAGAAYLLDPRQGTRRRRVLLDRTAKIVRRTAHLGAKKARFAGGHLRGLVALVRRLGSGRKLTIDPRTAAGP